LLVLALRLAPGIFRTIFLLPFPAALPPPRCIPPPHFLLSPDHWQMPSRAAAVMSFFHLPGGLANRTRGILPRPARIRRDPFTGAA